MGNVIEIAAGVYIVAIIGYVILYSRIKDWLCWDHAGFVRKHCICEHPLAILPSYRRE